MLSCREAGEAKLHWMAGSQVRDTLPLCETPNDPGTGGGGQHAALYETLGTFPELLL